MTNKRKGATQLRLDLHELRFQLIQADRIINEACAVMDEDTKGKLKTHLIQDGIGNPSDPLLIIRRFKAMHRVTTRHDYLKIALVVLALAMVLAWSCSQTENELLQAEVAQAHASK